MSAICPGLNVLKYFDVCSPAITHSQVADQSVAFGYADNAWHEDKFPTIRVKGHWDSQSISYILMENMDYYSPVYI